MNAFFNDVATKALSALAVAFLGYGFHLGSRVAKLEDKVNSQKDYTELMVKVDTLLETALKRLDIIEQHIFKL